MMLQIRNPWATEKGEWKGAWSDGSPEWEQVRISRCISVCYVASARTKVKSHSPQIKMCHSTNTTVNDWFCGQSVSGVLGH